MSTSFEIARSGLLELNPDLWERLIREGECAFGSYTLSFVKHDEGPNAANCDLDRHAWVMLLNSPLDCRHPSVMENVVLGFGHLVQIEDNASKCSIIVKVLLHDSAEIPDDVLVTMGYGPAVVLSPLL